MRTPRTALMLIAGTTLALSTACGGDDGGGGGSALSDEAFCARIVELEEQSDDLDEFDPAFTEALNELRASAPNDDVRDAIGTFIEFFEEAEALDEDDPEAFERLFEMMGSPELASAEAVLDDYTENVCGLDFDE